MKIIGLSGTNGSGKDALGDILAGQGWLAVSVSNFLREEATKRGQPIEREVLRTISAEWRREYGLGVLVDKAVELYKQSGDKYKGLVVNPMRNSGEAQHLIDLGGTLVWVDADPKLRYQRVNSRQRSAEDNKTYEQFLAEEEAEKQHSGDAATLDLEGVKKLADLTIINDGNNLEDFKAQAQKALKELL